MADESTNGTTGSSAVRAAAIAAATTAGLAAARAALARGSGGLGKPLVGAAWDAAREHLIGPAEDAVAALGRHVAESGPELLRERLVPRFLEAFEEARARDEGTSRESRSSGS